MNSIKLDNAIRAIESLANSQTMRSALPAHQQAINVQIAHLRAALREPSVPDTESAFLAVKTKDGLFPKNTRVLLRQIGTSNKYRIEEVERQGVMEPVRGVRVWLAEGDFTRV